MTVWATGTTEKGLEIVYVWTVGNLLLDVTGTLYAEREDECPLAIEAVRRVAAEVNAWAWPG
jgi:hypothetical protein